MRLKNKSQVTRLLRGVIAGLLGLAFVFAEAIADTGAVHARQVSPGSGDARIAVIYPDIGEPYRSVFEQIIAGIDDRAKTRVANFAVGPNADIDELKSNLRRQNIRVVIALGNLGVKVAAMLDRDIGVVVGCVITPPANEMRNVPVNSLSPAPALLFSHLKELMPSARRVFAVYEPRQSGWLISLAREDARAQGLELVAYEAQDLRNAVRVYQEIFVSADPRRDAVWLLQDSVSAENGTLLPLVLQESWNRNLTMFSSNFGHVRRGALFSLYPDNAKMGRHLANSALEFLASGEYGARGTILLRDVLLAINLRTADHLGLTPGNKQEFGMVFPEQ